MPRAVAAGTDPRRVALEVLERVATTGAFADVLLSHRLESSGLEGPDRGLATELVYGTLTWQGRIDHHLSSLVRGGLGALDLPVLLSLRLGLYQLLFLDRVPAYAAVDGSVRLVESSGRGAKGLVNAVLRRASRLGGSGLPLPDPADPIARVAVEWSHPRWLVARWAAELGLDVLPRALEANDRPAPTVLRTNLRRTTRAALLAELREAGLVAVEGAYVPTALVIERDAGRLRSLPAYREGRFAFQGEASQLVASLPTGPRVLDACAGAGGKTLAIAERLGPDGRVVAMDPMRAGLRRLVAERRRLGEPSVPAIAADARRPPTRSQFDTVLVDAPCSGLGTLRQHPELRWHRRPEDIPRLAELQLQILAGVAPLVVAGGTLVYAVCTRTTEETTGVIDAFLAVQPRFAVEPLAIACADADGFLRTAPHTHGLDGFFGARLRAAR